METFINTITNPAIIGLLTSVISSVLGWVLARRKYLAEVRKTDTDTDTTAIVNKEKDYDFQKRVNSESCVQLHEYAQQVRQLMIEVAKLNRATQQLYRHSCVVLGCKERIFVDSKEFEELIATSPKA